MVAGNRNKITYLISEIIFESIKQAFMGDAPICWESKSWAKSLEEFRQISQQSAYAITQNMENRGDVPYIKGKFTQEDLKRGIEHIKTYFEKVVVNKKYCRRRTKKFEYCFKSAFNKFMREWREKTNVYFSVCQERKDRNF